MQDLLHLLQDNPKPEVKVETFKTVPLTKQEVIPDGELFTSLISLIRSLLLLPFYLYLNVIQWFFVSVWLKLIFLQISFIERLPILGPKVTTTMTWLTENVKPIKWLYKYK